MKTTMFDVQNYLKTPEERAAYLEAILEDGDADLIASGLGDIARAYGPSELARRPAKRSIKVSRRAAIQP